MEPLYAKIISTITIFTMSCVFGILPIFVAKKYPMHTIESPSYNRKAKRNMIFSFLLNFGGGVLFANCFCHWLPEIREGKFLIFTLHENLRVSKYFLFLKKRGGKLQICASSFKSGIVTFYKETLTFLKIVFLKYNFP